MTDTKKLRKGIVTEPRPLTHEELIEFQQLNLIAGCERFKADEVKRNTSVVPNGQQLAEQLGAMATLFENARNQWMIQKLAELGYAPGERVAINPLTGQITRA